MRWLNVIALIIVLAASAAAYDLGSQAPVKTAPVVPQNVPDPDRQGGDTILDAMVIPSIPYNDNGTTAGYTDDYDEICPYSNSFSPDVVYTHSPAATIHVEIDLCGSGYDTKLFVYDAGLALVACNDDFYFDAICGVYVSRLENVVLAGGGTYYIVIDGYGSDFGDYLLDISVDVPCIIPCPAGGFPEGEPPLVPNYIDDWNGGCNTIPEIPFQDLVGDESGDLILCGVSGWYLFNGSNYRDTDWYHIYMGFNTVIEVAVDAEYEVYVFEIGPQSCNTPAVVQSAIAGPCDPAFMSITDYSPGGPVWFWVGPTVFADPDGGDNMFDYVCWFTGLYPVVANEPATWSTVKALFD